MDKTDVNQHVADLLSDLQEMKELMHRRVLRGYLERHLEYLEHHLERHLEQLERRHEKIKRESEERRKLLKLAEENCRNQTVLQWLKEKSESTFFFRLMEMYNYLKEKISEEEKKDHGDHVDITFVAHGSIRDFLVPASCLLPLPSIRDVVLYAPWNCITSGAAYGIATGRIKPEHRRFKCRKRNNCTIPDHEHQPINLPNHWNSMKKAGDQMIPNITLSPLRSDDGVWKHFMSFTEKHGEVGRNHIVIPFTPPGGDSGSVPFSVVTLALALVLLSSRFTATVHLDTCLGDQSTGQKFDKDYLQKQYAYTIDETVMKCSPDAYKPEEKSTGCTIS